MVSLLLLEIFWSFCNYKKHVITKCGAKILPKWNFLHVRPASKAISLLQYILLILLNSLSIFATIVLLFVYPPLDVRRLDFGRIQCWVIASTRRSIVSLSTVFVSSNCYCCCFLFFHKSCHSWIKLFLYFYWFYM